MSVADHAWRPAASLERIRARAGLLNQVRSFFQERNVLEVETPYLSQSAGTDPAIDPLVVCGAGQAQLRTGGQFLHTSPEFAMKRMLAAGVGDIFQIARVFRGGESGRHHNPEFTMLEWYRLEFDHWRLMDEVEELVRALLPSIAPIPRIAYSDLFEQALGLDPVAADQAQLEDAARRQGIEVDTKLTTREWLDLLFDRCIGPELAGNAFFVHGFPAAQAALARLDPDDRTLARRFELIVDGMEIANGFHELSDPLEQRRRFDAELRERRSAGSPEVPMDEKLLSALDAGLPDCSGVAMGLDRLLMLMTGAGHVHEVLAFPPERA